MMVRRGSQSLIDQWIDFSANEIDLPAAAWLYPIFEIVPFNAEATERAKADIKKALDMLNKHLTYRTFLVGERVSLADIVVSMSLHRLYTTVRFPHLLIRPRPCRAWSWRLAATIPSSSVALPFLLWALWAGAGTGLP